MQDASTLEVEPSKAVDAVEFTTRNETIDVVRLVAAVGIIYIHAIRSPALDASRNLFRFAVPFYLFASLFYQAQSLRRKTSKTFLEVAWGRVKRLYVPFLAWSVVYLLARDLKHISMLGIGSVGLNVGMLWKGVEYHLWFLPYLLIWSLVLTALDRGLLRRWSVLRWPVIVVSIAAGLVVALSPMPSSWDETFDNPTYAYVQFWRAFPAASWALGFALFMTARSADAWVPRWVGWLGLLLTLVCSAMQVFQGISLIPRAATGLGTMLMALAPWRLPLTPLLARLGRYSYGIYLCHVLVVELVRAVIAKLHFGTSIATDLLIFVVSCAASLAVVKTLSRWRATIWLNG